MSGLVLGGHLKIVHTGRWVAGLCGEERIMERYSNRENVIALYLKEHLGGAEVKTLVDHRNHEIVFYLNAGAEPPLLRPLQLSFAMVADHDMEQLEEILDSPRSPSRTIRTFSSGANFLRVQRRISRTAASVDCFFVLVISRRSPGSRTPYSVS